MDRLYNAIGLCKRAGRLVSGAFAVQNAIRAGKAKLILLASDASTNARKRAEGFAAQGQVPLLVLQADKAELCCAAGVAGGAMFAVCDDGFAAALQKKLQAETVDEIRD